MRSARIAIAMAIGLVASFTSTGAVTAGAPLRMLEDSTSLSCDALYGDGGVVRLTASVSSLSGTTGFLSFWATPADPAFEQPSLLSLEMNAALQPDGSLTATFEMYVLGDLGIAAAGPEFVGTAVLEATFSASGPAEVLDEVTRNGNGRFRLQGTRQTLDVSGGVTVPTGGDFQLSGCSGVRESLSYFATQPDADVSTIDRTWVQCFWETDDGFVALEAQTDETDTFAYFVAVDAEGFYFGQSVPELSPAGISTIISLDPTGEATVSAQFAAADRVKFRQYRENGWVMVTIDILHVDGSISVATPAGTQVLAMDDTNCLADSRKVISLATSPGA